MNTALLSLVLLGNTHSQPTFGRHELVCKLDIPQVTESSGVCESPTKPGIYYTHNDSGDSPRFFAFDRNGKRLDEVQLRAADAVDWEDCAAAKVKGTSFLYFGDIGDNEEKRASIQIYRVPEPGIPADTTKVYHRYEMKYPDGPHNCEAMMVDPAQGNVWLVTKTNKGPSRVYMAAAPFTTMEPNKFKFMGEIKFDEQGQFGNLVTGGDISPDGKWVVLRTYLAAYEWPAKGMKNWWKGNPARIQLSLEAQGEAICYSNDGSELFTTSEGSPMPFSRITISR